MLSPNDTHMALEIHKSRVEDALRSGEMRRRLEALDLPAPHRQALARLGDALVDIGTRLQENDPRRQPAPRLDTLGTA